MSRGQSGDFAIYKGTLLGSGGWEGIQPCHLSAGNECNERDNETRPIAYLGLEGGEFYIFKMVRRAVLCFIPHYI